MTPELQVDLALRLLAAAVLGGLVGAEREVHEHPAGMRTHLLVAVGCALFTELSIYAFTLDARGDQVDPSRVAAQIVTGMGFLGAGAILKYGTSIRGLTTAASLWATSAIGIAAGTGQYVLAIVGTGLVVFSLWPLTRVARLLRMRNAQALRVRLAMGSLESLGDVSKVLDTRRITIEGVQVQRRTPGYFELELDLRLPMGTAPAAVVTTIDAVAGVDLVEMDRAVE